VEEDYCCLANDWEAAKMADFSGLLHVANEALVPVVLANSRSAHSR
jgi:hypothetical protein